MERKLRAFCVIPIFMCHMPDHPMFENIANSCGVKTCHRPLMDVNGLKQFRER